MSHFLVFIFTDIQSSKAERIAAIKETASTLRQRLMLESKRLADLVQTKQQQRSTSTSPPKIPQDSPTFSSFYPGSQFILFIDILLIA